MADTSKIVIDYTSGLLEEPKSSNVPEIKIEAKKEEKPKTETKKSTKKSTKKTTKKVVKAAVEETFATPETKTRKPKV